MFRHLIFLQSVLKFSWTVARRDARGSRDEGFWGAKSAQWTIERHSPAAIVAWVPILETTS